jgi:ribosome biogenesis GTPase A
VHQDVIQWYPGHMAQTMRKIGEQMRLIDIVVEVIDARAPRASRNPHLDEIASRKQRLIIIGREDLADPQATADWVSYFERKSGNVIAVNGKDQGSVSRAIFQLTRLANPRTNTRALVVGIPNTGKSSIINGLLRRSAAKAEDKAGVTRSLQWFRMSPTLELMDSPGILVPRIDTPAAQWQLAITGALPRERYDPEQVAEAYHTWLLEATGGRTRVPDLAAYGRSRGFLRKGDRIDEHTAARAYIKDFGDGKFGRTTFERVENPA